MGWGVHLFGLCIIWHTSIAEKPQSSLPLIHMSSVRPAGWGFAWSFRSFTLGVKAEGADTVSRWGVACGSRDSRLSAHRQWCCSRGRCRGAHMSVCEADIIFFVSLHVDNGFCQDVILYSMLSHMLTLASETGFQWEFCLIKFIWRLQHCPHKLGCRKCQLQNIYNFIFLSLCIHYHLWDPELLVVIYTFLLSWALKALKACLIHPVTYIHTLQQMHSGETEASVACPRILGLETGEVRRSQSFHSRILKSNRQLSNR